MCDCELPIYDRFPLVDGTLFVSPFMYDKARSIPAVVGNKQQYINAVCLKCMMGETDHEIKCLSCNQLWQKCGGTSFQLGTLYKFDLFAALPCCQRRLTCANCDANLVEITAVHGSATSVGEFDFYFSWFSEERACAKCKVKTHHFVKPLREIYVRSDCEAKRETALSGTLANTSSAAEPATTVTEKD